MIWVKLANQESIPGVSGAKNYHESGRYSYRPVYGVRSAEIAAEEASEWIWSFYREFNSA